jgi:hypothetical protein
LRCTPRLYVFGPGAGWSFARRRRKASGSSIVESHIRAAQLRAIFPQMHLSSERSLTRQRSDHEPFPELDGIDRVMQARYNINWSLNTALESDGVLESWKSSTGVRFCSLCSGFVRKRGLLRTKREAPTRPRYPEIA